GGGRDGDVHAAESVDRVEVDLREDDLLLHAHVVVAATVEGTAGHAAEVAHARQRDVDQAVQELEHTVAAQGDLAADGPAVTDLERRHGNAGLGGHRLLAGDLGHVGHGVLQHLLVAGGLAHAHVQRDLDEPGDLHRIGVAELLHQSRHHLFLVELFEPRGHDFIPQASSASPLERNTRILRPSSRILYPMRSPLPVAGLSGITLEMWIEASRSTTPPAMPACGFGLVCRLTRFTLETTTRSPSTLMTSPCLPLSLPAMTTTVSPFLMRFAMSAFLRSEHFRRERDDLHELLGTQLTGNRPEDAGADRLLLVVQQHGGVAVEADHRAVRTAHALAGAHHHGVVDLALLHLAARNRVLDGHLDDVANTRVAALGTAE